MPVSTGRDIVLVTDSLLLIYACYKQAEIFCLCRIFVFFFSLSMPVSTGRDIVLVPDSFLLLLLLLLLRKTLHLSTSS
jgi:hypothetical protein